MNLIIERVKNIIRTPKTEWLIIEAESTFLNTLITGYVLPLSIVYCLGVLLYGALWSGIFGFEYFAIASLIKFITAVVYFLVGTYTVDMLAPNFESQKNLIRSAQLIAYSSTPFWVAGLFSFIPYLGWLILFAGGVYSVYLMYLGIGPLKKTPEDKKVVYMIIQLVITLIIGGLINYLLRLIFFRTMGYDVMHY
jgi:hypothetical protein